MGQRVQAALRDDRHASRDHRLADASSAPCRWRTPRSGPGADHAIRNARGGALGGVFLRLPACDDASVLSTVSGRFSQTENTYWGGQHAIDGFERVKEIGFRSNGLAYIPRRYCVARAMMDDPRATPPIERRPTTVVYDVTADAGIIGFNWGVEWCVVGFDREHAYEPACDVLRPILERWIGDSKAVGYGLKARY